MRQPLAGATVTLSELSDAGSVLRRWTLRTSDEGLTVETVQDLNGELPALERVMRLVLERSG